MTSRLSRDEAEGYWQDLHKSTRDALEAVCFPGKSRLLNRFFDRTEKRAIRRALGTIVGPMSEKAVLDVGCGRGRWLEFYQALGAQPFGVDIAPAAVTQAAARGFDVRVESVDALSFDDATFDLVSEVAVLLHLPSEIQVGATKEMERVCRPGGYILLLDITSGDPSPHVFPRRLQEWVSMFEDSTLVYVENHYFAWPLRFLWRSPAMRLPHRAVRLLENLAVLASMPLERLAMLWYRGKPGSRGLQHLMILRRHEAKSPQ